MNDIKRPAPLQRTLTRRGVVPHATQPPKAPKGTHSVVHDERFAFVWRSDGRRPRKRHPTVAAAMIEAERLAEANPHADFGVYEARRVAKVRRP